MHNCLCSLRSRSSLRPRAWGKGSADVVLGDPRKPAAQVLELTTLAIIDLLREFAEDLALRDAKITRACEERRGRLAPAPTMKLGQSCQAKLRNLSRTIDNAVVGSPHRAAQEVGMHTEELGILLRSKQAVSPIRSGHWRMFSENGWNRQEVLEAARLELATRHATAHALAGFRAALQCLLSALRHQLPGKMRSGLRHGVVDARHWATGPSRQARANTGRVTEVRKPTECSGDNNQHNIGEKTSPGTKEATSRCDDNARRPHGDRQRPLNKWQSATLLQVWFVWCFMQRFWGVFREFGVATGRAPPAPRAQDDESYVTKTDPQQRAHVGAERGEEAEKKGGIVKPPKDGQRQEVRGGRRRVIEETDRSRGCLVGGGKVVKGSRRGVCMK